MVELPYCFETKKKSRSSRFNAYNQRLNADRQILIAAFRAVNKATYNFIRKREIYIEGESRLVLSTQYCFAHFNYRLIM